MVDPRVLEAFQIMWGPFPEPVMLVHRDRTVLGLNDLARRIGIPTGIKCHSLNPEGAPGGQCRRCRANQALRTGETVCCEEESVGRPVRGYWMPLKEVPDVYVHFGIGTAEAMAAMQAAPHAAKV
jgi:hypothetical protein